MGDSRRGLGMGGALLGFLAVAAMVGRARIATAAGITIGSTVAQLKAAYGARRIRLEPDNPSAFSAPREHSAGPPSVHVVRPPIALPPPRAVEGVAAVRCRYCHGCGLRNDLGTLHLHN
jgi:hypothetical protein